MAECREDLRMEFNKYRIGWNVMEVVTTYCKILFRQSTPIISRNDQQAYPNRYYSPFKPRYKVRLAALWER
jgi:hypothetical protein